MVRILDCLDTASKQNAYKYANVRNASGAPRCCRKEMLLVEELDASIRNPK